MTAQTKKTKTTAPVVKLIQLDHLDANPHNPRDLAGLPEDSPGLVALADSLRSVGILQPLNVRTQAGKKKGRYLIIAGHRRALAARLAGLTAVPCFIDDARTAERQLIAPLAENLAREGLPALHIVEQIAKLKDDGASGTKIAAAIGRSQAFVSKALRVARWLAEDAEARPDPAAGLDALYYSATYSERVEALAEKNRKMAELEQATIAAKQQVEHLIVQRTMIRDEPAFEEAEPVAGDMDEDTGDQLPLTGVPAAPAPPKVDRLDVVRGYVDEACRRHKLDIQMTTDGPDMYTLTIRASLDEIAKVAHTVKVYN